MQVGAMHSEVDTLHEQQKQLQAGIAPRVQGRVSMHGDTGGGRACMGTQGWASMHGDRGWTSMRGDTEGGWACTGTQGVGGGPE